MTPLRLAFLVGTVAAVAATPAMAQTPSSELRYEEYYGDGIRAYTEERYEAALDNLYRAFALKQTPYALKLITRTHDFMGNCSARTNTAELMKDLYPGETAPPAQRCTQTATVDIVCARGQGRVRVDDSFYVDCGTSVEVPAGKRRFENVFSSMAVELDVDAGDTAKAWLTAKPHKWLASESVPIRLRADPDMPRTFKWK